MGDDQSTMMSSRLDWAAGLMPMLLHELNNATQFLGMLHSVHSQDPSAGLFERSAQGLGETAATVEDLGLLMAIVSTAAGTDLLLERRSPRGVDVTLNMTIRALRKRGIDVELVSAARLTPSRDEAMGWELPWAIAGSAWAAAASMKAGDALKVELDTNGWGAECPATPEVLVHAEAALELVSELSFQSSEAGWRFTLPEGWVSTPS